MSGPTSTSFEPTLPSPDPAFASLDAAGTSAGLGRAWATRRRLLQSLGALAATPWLVRADAAAAVAGIAPLRLPLHLTQMVNHIGISVTDVKRSATFYSHLFEQKHLLGQEKPALRYIVGFNPGAVSIGPLQTSGPDAHARSFIDHFAVSAQPFDLAAWRARLHALGVPYFAGGTFVNLDGVNLQLLGGRAGPPRRRPPRGAAPGGFMPMPALYSGEPLLEAHGFERVMLSMANLDAATDTLRTLFGVPPHRTDSGRVFFRVGGIELGLDHAPDGVSRIASFAIKVGPFDKAKVAEALTALGAKLPGRAGSGSGPFGRRAASRPDNPSALAFSDPDGIQCELWPA
ncbi:MAG: hypothetical protein ACRETB_06690 [Steroidobacteraceae bacterium]